MTKYIEAIRELIGDKYFYDEHRGAKTNELGMTKSQVIQLAEEIAEYIESLKQ